MHVKIIDSASIFICLYKILFTQIKQLIKWSTHKRTQLKYPKLVRPRMSERVISYPHNYLFKGTLLELNGAQAGTVTNGHNSYKQSI